MKKIFFFFFLFFSSSAFSASSYYNDCASVAAGQPFELRRPSSGIIQCWVWTPVYNWFYQKKSYGICPADSPWSDSKKDCYKPPVCSSSEVYNATRDRCEPDCPAPGIYNSETNTCEKCKAGQVAASGDFSAPYPWGWNSKFPPVVCYSGCTASFSGDCPVGQKTINGKTVTVCRGSYTLNGSECSSADGGSAGWGAAPPTAVDTSKPDTCAPGQTQGTVNGNFYCSGTPSSSGSSSPASPPTTTSPGSSGSGSGTGGGVGDGSGSGSGSSSGSSGGSTGGSSGGSGGTGGSSGSTIEKPLPSIGQSMPVTGSNSSRASGGSSVPPAGASVPASDRWSPPSGSGGSFDIAAAVKARDEANSRLQSKFEEIKNEISALWGDISEGGGSLPCYSGVEVLGKQIPLCFSDYSEELSSLADMVLLIAAIVSAAILFS